MSLTRVKKTIYGWKAAYIIVKKIENLKAYYVKCPVLVKLRINRGTKVVTPNDSNFIFGIKHRSSRAHVEAVYFIEDTTFEKPLPEDTVVHSYWDHSYRYCIGDTIRPKFMFDEDSNAACSSGIHFFDDYGAADRYNQFNGIPFEFIERNWVVQAELRDNYLKDRKFYNEKKKKETKK